MHTGHSSLPVKHGPIVRTGATRPSDDIQLSVPFQGRGDVDQRASPDCGDGATPEVPHS